MHPHNPLHLSPDHTFVAVDIVVALRSSFGQAVGIEAALEDCVKDVQLMLP